MKNISRRKFIIAAPVVAGALLHLQNGLTLGQAVEPDALARLSYSSFLPFVYTDFQFGGIGVPEAVLTLASIGDSRPAQVAARLGSRKECFCLTFRGSTKTPLVQGTYDVTHFRLGEFRLFISVDRTVGSEMTYNAIVNRYIPGPDPTQGV